MTEKEVRSVIVLQAQAWLGRSELDGSHRYIIDVYNSLDKLPVGYEVKYSDDWCAAFVSAVAVKCGLEHIVFPECGCGRMIDLYKKAGEWVEDDAYIPTPADLIFYDWQDAGYGDNQGEADHVGLVESVDSGIISVIEGNLNDAVRRRSIRVNAKGIRGYAVPAYWMYAEETEEQVKRYNRVADCPEWARPAVIKLIDKGVLSGSGRVKDADGRPGDLDLSHDMLRTIVILNRLGVIQ